MSNVTIVSKLCEHCNNRIKLHEQCNDYIKVARAMLHLKKTAYIQQDVDTAVAIGIATHLRCS